MHRYHDFEDQDDEAPAIAPDEELADLLDRLDRCRMQIDLGMRQLGALLKQHPALDEKYQAQDFERFQQGRLRSRLTPSRAHLRMIHNRKPVVGPKIRGRTREPDDAA